ncbi:LuxR C-terminal-related transcriptional regulator [Catellatospora aurea]|uniref:LuxR C-terminal-related transcriptional regulator n=1 Tax=Catellatospora aurea TaxID=1337874 RepID=A0ABW2HAA1_9ACTN
MRELYRLVVGLCERGPVLVVLDDLQWADLESVRWLVYVAARVERLPVVVLGALRPGVDEVDRLVAGFASSARVLEPLSVAGGGALLGGVVDGGGGLAARCHELTGGNPLLLRELCGQLVGAGSVEEGFARGVVGVRRLIQAQVRQLPVGAVRVAQALSVLPGSVEAVAWTAGVGAGEALHQLAVLQGNRLVVEEGPQRFVFAHEVIGAAVYEGVRPGLRAELHLRAAGAAMRTHDVVGAASHLLRVPARWGDVDAVSVLGQAAEVCLARGSVDSAVVFLRRLLEEELGAGRGRVLTRLGMAEYLVDAGQAVQHLTAALVLEGDAAGRADIGLALALSLFFSGRPAAAHEIASESLREAPEAAESSRHALAAVAIITAYSSRDAAALQPDLDRLSQTPAAPSVGGMMLEAAMSWRDACRNDVASAQFHALRAADLAALHAQPLGDGLLARAWHVLELCSSPAVLPSVDAGLARAERSGSPRAVALARCHRGMALAAQGSPREAVVELALGWAEAKRCETELTRLHIGANYVMALLQAGDVATADAVHAEMAAVAPQEIVSSVYGLSEIMLLIVHGEIDRALEGASALRGECTARGITNPLFPDWRTPMVSCLSRLGRVDEAQEVAREFVDLAAAWGTPRAVGRSLLAAAEAASGQERIDLLFAAKEQFVAGDLKSDLATTLHRLGESLRRADKPEIARTHLHLAHDVAVECGADAVAQDAAVSLRLLGVRPRNGHADRPRHLTPSEARVVELAAAGRSNREIAQELYIAVKTVEIHLTSAFRKLGVSRRLDLRQTTGQADLDRTGRTTPVPGAADAP